MFRRDRPPPAPATRARATRWTAIGSRPGSRRRAAVGAALNRSGVARESPRLAASRRPAFGESPLEPASGGGRRGDQAIGSRRGGAPGRAQPIRSRREPPGRRRSAARSTDRESPWSRLEPAAGAAPGRSGIAAAVAEGGGRRGVVRRSAVAPGIAIAGGGGQGALSRSGVAGRAKSPGRGASTRARRLRPRSPLCPDRVAASCPPVSRSRRSRPLGARLS